MSDKYYVFPDPLDATCVLVHDTGGWTLTAAPDLHPSGRPGQSFTIPLGTPQDNGARLTITAPKKVPENLRGVLHVAPLSTFSVDDFHLADATVTLPRLVLNGDVLKQDVP